MHNLSDDLGMFTHRCQLVPIAILISSRVCAFEKQSEPALIAGEGCPPGAPVVLATT
jgi:hypothetical protein